MDEDKRLHLQFIQNNISRMNTNSCHVKGWCVTMVSALFALCAGTGKPFFIWICFIPIILFFLLDAYYLQQEHKLIELYNNVANITKKNIEIKPYDFPLRLYKKDFKKALCSWSILPFYLIVCILTISLGFLLI